MITVSNALFSLTPNAQWTISNNDYDTIIWHTPEIPQPSRSEVEEEVVRLTYNIPFEECKAEAKKRIAASDWAVLPDVGISNVDEFTLYRSVLRGLIRNPVPNPTFPTEPQPVWIS